MNYQRQTIFTKNILELFVVFEKGTGISIKQIETKQIRGVFMIMFPPHQNFLASNVGMVK